MANDQVRQITVAVKGDGVQALRDMAKSFGDLNTSTKSVASSLDSLTDIFKGLAAYFSIKELIDLSDEFQILSNKLDIVFQSSTKTEAALKSISDIAQSTNQPIKEVGDTYSRLAISLQSVNPSVGELNALTQTLINSFRISGATTSEATGAINGLSTAFSTGVLTGRQLKSILSDNAALALILKQRFGRDLFDDAKQGLITTADFLKILGDNAQRINQQAEELTPTFGQTLTKAFNIFTDAVGELNQEFNVSGKFAEAMQFVIDKSGLIVTALGVIALTAIPQLITAVEALGVALAAFTYSNPITAIAAAIGVAIVFLFRNFDDLKNKLEIVSGYFYDFAGTIVDTIITMEKAVVDGLAAIGIQSDVTTDILNGQIEIAQKLHGEAQKLWADAHTLQESVKASVNGGSLDTLATKTDVLGNSLKDVQRQIAELNKEYLAGQISIEDYNKKLQGLQLDQIAAKMRLGQQTIIQYNAELRKIEISDLNDQFRSGVLSLQDYDKAVQGVHIDELNEKFRTGQIDIYNYTQQLAKLQDTVNGNSFAAGAAQYLTSIGTLSQQIAGGINNAFGSLESTFTNFIKTGKLDFASFTQSILDDLEKIIVRASIVKPLADALLSSFGGGTSGGTTTTDSGFQAAKGAAFTGAGVRYFASGGVVNSPTPFSFGGGQPGVMGEAGPEAIIPLQRGSDGSLGIQGTVSPVVVNIINQNGSQVTQQSKTGPNGEQQIDVIIATSVKKTIQGGGLDATFKSNYGIVRKGQ